jgi:hypothetical protein
MLIGKTMQLKTLSAAGDTKAKMRCRLLLAGVSALAMLVHAAPAAALCLGRCGAGGTSATTAAANLAIMSAQQAAAATQQSMNALSRDASHSGDAGGAKRRAQFGPLGAERSAKWSRLGWLGARQRAHWPRCRRPGEHVGGCQYTDADEQQWPNHSNNQPDGAAGIAELADFQYRGPNNRRFQPAR